MEFIADRFLSVSLFPRSAPSASRGPRKLGPNRDLINQWSNYSIGQLDRRLSSVVTPLIAALWRRTDNNGRDKAAAAIKGKQWAGDVPHDAVGSERARGDDDTGE